MIHEIINAIGPIGLPSALSFFVLKLGAQCRRAPALLPEVFWTMACLCASPPWAGPRTLSEDQNLEFLCDSVCRGIGGFSGQIPPSYLIAKESYVGAFWVTLLFYVSRFASFVIPAYLGYSPEVIIGCFSGVAVIRALAFAVYFTFMETGRLSGPAREGWSIKELYTYGAPLSASLIVGKLNVQVDKYMILYLLSPAAFAVFTVGAIELPLVASLAYSVTTALVPTLVKAHQSGNTAEFINYWHGSMAKVATVMMPLFVFFMIFAEPAMRVFFSSSRSRSDPLPDLSVSSTNAIMRIWRCRARSRGDETGSGSCGGWSGR